MQPMANPRASVNASRRGVTPCRSQVAAFRFIDAMGLVITTSLSGRDRFLVKRWSIWENGRES
jgi:hypothetical protein